VSLVRVLPPTAMLVQWVREHRRAPCASSSDDVERDLVPLWRALQSRGADATPLFVPFVQRTTKYRTVSQWVDVMLSFVAQHGREPRRVPPECSLFDWLDSVRSGHRVVTDDQRARLESAGVRTVRLVARARSSQEIVHDVLDFTRTRGTEPFYISTDNEERYLGLWVKNVRGGIVTIDAAARAQLESYGVRVHTVR